MVDHRLFKEMACVLRLAPLDYKPLNRQRLYGSQLEATVLSLQSETAGLREAVLRDCGTFMSDGWDTADHDHLINFIYGNASCSFFDGTVELASSDHENAQMVYNLMAAAIERVGPLAIIQVVTDTCAVMQVG